MRITISFILIVILLLLFTACGGANGDKQSIIGSSIAQQHPFPVSSEEPVSNDINADADTQQQTTSQSEPPTSAAESSVSTAGPPALTAEPPITTAKSETLPPLSPLSFEAESKMKEDFAAYMSEFWQDVTFEDILTLKYYGTYNGCEAVVMWGKGRDMTDDIKEIEIAGYTFQLNSGSLNLMLHKDSSFINISDAYAQGYLSENDIYKIKYYSDL